MKNMVLFQTKIKMRGFTIIELITIIAVIGILATISVVGYGSWRTSVTVAQLKSDLNGAAAAMEDARTFGNSYPLSVPSTFTPSSGVTLSGGGSTNGKSFWLDATSGGQSYNINQDKVVSAGTRPVLYLDAGVAASYPGTGTIWTDLSGNSGGGTLVNNVVYSSDNGGVLVFNGASNYVSIPYAAQYNIRNAITLSIWIKRTTGFNQLQDTMILGRPPAWYFYDAYNSGDIYADVFIDGVRRGTQTATVPFDPYWYQITYTYDSNTHISSMYKNGALSSSVTLTGLSNYLIDASTADFAPMGYNSASRGMMLNGACVYSRALSATEISQSFNVSKSRYGL